MSTEIEFLASGLELHYQQSGERMTAKLQKEHDTNFKR